MSTGFSSAANVPNPASQEQLNEQRLGSLNLTTPPQAFQQYFGTISSLSQAFYLN